MKTIFVACGTGGVTSKNVAMKLEKFLKTKNIPCKIDTCKVIEVPSKIKTYHPDLVVSATKLPENLECPSVSSSSFLTGVGIDKAYNEVLEKLK